MAETSTQALIAAVRAALVHIPSRPYSITKAVDALERLAAELARLSTPPEGSNGEDVAPARPVVDAQDAPSPTRGGAVGETVPIREAVARVIYPRFSRSPTSLSADNQAISALRKADRILALISPPHPTSEDS